MNSCFYGLNITVPVALIKMTFLCWKIKKIAPENPSAQLSSSFTRSDSLWVVSACLVQPFGISVWGGEISLLRSFSFSNPDPNWHQLDSFGRGGEAPLVGWWGPLVVKATCLVSMEKACRKEMKWNECLYPEASGNLGVQSLGWEDSPGGGNGNTLQYFCLENFHRLRSLVGYSSRSSQRVEHHWVTSLSLSGNLSHFLVGSDLGTELEVIIFDSVNRHIWGMPGPGWAEERTNLGMDSDICGWVTAEMGRLASSMMSAKGNLKGHLNCKICQDPVSQLWQRWEYSPPLPIELFGFPWFL